MPPSTNIRFRSCQDMCIDFKNLFLVFMTIGLKNILHRKARARDILCTNGNYRTTKTPLLWVFPERVSKLYTA